LIANRLLVFVCLTFTLASVAIWVFWWPHPQMPSPPKSTPTNLRHVTYSFTLQNTRSQPLVDAGLWTFAPLARGPYQQQLQLSASHPYQVYTDPEGNQLLFFDLKPLAPFGARIITIEAQLALTAARAMDAGIYDDPAPYLEPQRYIEADHPSIVATAQRHQTGNPMITARRLLEFVAAHMRYDGYRRQARGALYALQAGKGDCTEYMYLFVALCRAAGIPARGVGGYICPTNMVLTPDGYHNWAEFYDQGVWRIADPLNRVIAPEAANYMALRILGTRRGQGRDAGFQRYKSRGDGLHVKMNS
jgi:transglutaminase-like putative cysteine protease